MNTRQRRLLLELASVLFFVPLSGVGAEFGFNRIIHGWTNYSTAFNATESLDSSGQYATIATPYHPLCDVLLKEYRIIVVWAGPVGEDVDFTNFDFHVLVWSGLEAFTNSPLHGDVATLDFSTPSSRTRDATTRAGRTAYELRFPLTNANVALSHQQNCLMGFNARNHVRSYPDLYVPTSSFSGASDLQAGNILVQGSIQIVEAGGTTIYSGQLATALLIEPLYDLPSLAIKLTDGLIMLSWAGLRRLLPTRAFLLRILRVDSCSGKAPSRVGLILCLHRASLGF